MTGTPEGSKTIEGAQTPNQRHALVVQGPIGQLSMGPMVEGDLGPGFRVHGAPMIVLNEDEQHKYEKFKKMDPPQF